MKILLSRTRRIKEFVYTEKKIKWMFRLPFGIPIIMLSFTEAHNSCKDPHQRKHMWNVLKLFVEWTSLKEGQNQAIRSKAFQLTNGQLFYCYSNELEPVSFPWIIEWKRRKTKSESNLSNVSFNCCLHNFPCHFDDPRRWPKPIPIVWLNSKKHS